ncbi:MAG: helix-turn-helix transcriptional regulator [Phycisphaerales bacterium]
MRVSEKNRLIEDARNSELITVRHVSAILYVSQRTIWNFVTAGKIPPPVSVGRLKRWRAAEIRAWIAEGCPEQTEAA